MPRNKKSKNPLKLAKEKVSTSIRHLLENPQEEVVVEPTSPEVKAGNLAQLQKLWEQWSKREGGDSRVTMTLDTVTDADSQTIPILGIKPSLTRHQISIKGAPRPKDHKGALLLQLQPLKCPMDVLHGTRREREATMAFWCGQNCIYRLEHVPTNNDDWNLHLKVKSPDNGHEMEFMLQQAQPNTLYKFFGHYDLEEGYVRGMNGVDSHTKDLLGARVLHLFLREYAWVLPFKITEYFLESIEETYTKDGHDSLKESVSDLRQLKADLIHFLMPGSSVTGTGSDQEGSDITETDVVLKE